LVFSRQGRRITKVPAANKANKADVFLKLKEVFIMTTKKNSWLANLLAKHSTPRTAEMILVEAENAVLADDYDVVDELRCEVSDFLAESVVSGDKEAFETLQKAESILWSI
jgi:hypothetical protein